MYVCIYIYIYIYIILYIYSVSEAPPQPSGCEQQPRGLLLSPQRVSGLAVGGGWLVAAMSGGCVRTFRLPSHEERAPVDLGELLPAQDSVVVGNLALVAGRRAIFLVDVEEGRLLQKLTTPFSGRPSVVAKGPSIFAKCDEAIRVWPLGVLGSAGGGDEAQDLSKPHRQITTGLAVLPGGRSVITSSPEEVRGWSWPPASAQGTELLWTLSLKELCPSAQGAWETSSLMWWRQGEADAASVVLRGDQGGRVVFHELRLGARFAETPKLAARVLPAEECSVDDAGRDDPSASCAPGLILMRRGAGWVACAARAPPAGLSPEVVTAVVASPSTG